MKNAAILCVCLLATCAQVRVCCAEDARNTITVSATATVERKPDVAYVTVFARGQGFLMAEVAKTASEKAYAVVKAVREKHGEIKDIEVVDVEVGQKGGSYWGSESASEPPRPEIVKRIRIAIPPTPALAYEITDTAIRAGAGMAGPSYPSFSDEPSGVIMYGLLDPVEAEDEASKEALVNAAKEAGKIASLAGVGVRAIVSIIASGPVDYVGIIRSANGQADRVLKHAGVNPDKVEVSRTVVVSYEVARR